MSHRVPFIRPVFRGARYDDHSLPVEVLPDLAAYRDLIVELAAELFRRDHPARQKLPKNFADGFQLKLATIAEGSAVPCLDRIATAGLPLSPDADCFDRAQALVMEAMWAAQNDGPLTLPEGFPQQLLARFNSLGRSLRDDEAIEWTSGQGAPGPRYDRKVRKRLVLKTAQTYEQDVDLVGTVVGHEWPKDAPAGKLTVDLEGRPVAVAFQSGFAATVRTILGSDEPLVRLTGTGVFDGSDRLLKVIATHSLDLVESATPAREAAWRQVESDLDRLASLQDGWLDGGGTSYPSTLIEAARALLAALLERGVPAPCVLPTSDGEVRLEWSPSTPYDVSACLDADGKQVYLHSSPGLDGEFDERSVAHHHHETLVDFLRAHGVREEGTP